MHVILCTQIQAELGEAHVNIIESKEVVPYCLKGMYVPFLFSHCLHLMAHPHCCR